MGLTLVWKRAIIVEFQLWGDLTGMFSGEPCVLFVARSGIYTIYRDWLTSGLRKYRSRKYQITYKSDAGGACTTCQDPVLGYSTGFRPLFRCLLRPSRNGTGRLIFVPTPVAYLPEKRARGEREGGG